MRLPLGPISLLAVALVFSLPFIEMSCQRRQALVLTGYEAAFGKEVEVQIPLGPLIDLGQQGGRKVDTHFSVTVDNHARTEGRPLFAAALIVAVLAGALAFRSRTFGALGGLATVVLLLAAQSRVQADMQEQHLPMLVTLSFQPGFWIALACAAAGGVLCLVESRKT